MAYPSLDLPTLSQKNFDVKEWIEQILRQRNDGKYAFSSGIIGSRRLT